MSVIFTTRPTEASIMRPRLNDVFPSYCHGYLHGRNGWAPAAQGEAYQRGYQDGQSARKVATAQAKGY